MVSFYAANLSQCYRTYTLSHKIHIFSLPADILTSTPSYG